MLFFSVEKICKKYCEENKKKVNKNQHKKLILKKRVRYEAQFIAILFINFQIYGFNYEFLEK
jgi:hypothetical protein